MEMTMNVYGHVTLDNQRGPLDLLNDQITVERSPANERRCCQRPLSIWKRDRRTGL